MRLLLLLLLLLLQSAAPQRVPGPGPGSGRRGRGRAGLVRRQTQECKEYTEAGEKYLDCMDRRLTGVTPGWPADIQHLLLARNQIQVLRDHMFSAFPRLKSLDLQQNLISQVEDGAFSGLSQLTTLLLQHNRLRSASEEALLPLPRLTYLRLYDNPWTCGCALDSLVRTLQVPGNRNLGNYAKCSEPPELRGSKLKKLNVDLLCSRDSRVEKRPGSSSTGQTRPPPLQVKPDPTWKCHTYMFPKPQLDCSSKELTGVPADVPTDVVKMDLSRNQIHRLRSKQFVLSKDLKLLNLSWNALQRVDTAAFAGLLYLRELDLSNNRLHHFQYGVLEDLYYLRTLRLDQNPWTCDYNIHYLVYWLKHHPGVSHSGLFCSEPPEFQGWRVEDYVKTYNGECPKDRQLGPADGTGQGAAAGTGPQEVTRETEEEPQPGPLKEKKREKFEIIQLS
ncbi:leucine-rich repeat-containing protein 17 [Neosynchiropus ocellatus]